MENNNLQKQTDGKAVASLVLGIIAVVFSFSGGLAFIGIIPAIVGLVLGVSARKNNPSGMATAGFVLSVIGLVFSAVLYLACVACVGALSTIN